MRTLPSLFILALLSMLASCNVGGSKNSNGIISNHQNHNNEFTLSTTTNVIYLPGQTINFNLTFPVSATIAGGTPSISVIIGTNSRTATYVSGSGTSTLVFSYNVQAGENDSDGINVSPNVNLNGATCTYYSTESCGLNVVVPSLSSVKVSATSNPIADNMGPITFNEDTQQIVTLSYTDPEGDLASSCTVVSVTNVTETLGCSCNGAGVCTVGVTGTSHYYGSASFTYHVTVNGQETNTATASLSITSVSDAPLTSNFSDSTLTEDTQKIITLSHTVVGGDAATSCNVSNLSNITESQVCSCSAGVCTVGVTGNLNYFGAASFDYTISSASAVSTLRTATLTIASVNDLPVISVISAQNTNANTPIAVNFTFTDVESTLTCSAARLSMTSSDTGIVSNAAVAWSGSVPNCTATITPVTNAYGTTTITITGTDLDGGSTNRVFNLTVNGIVLIWTDSGGTTITNYDFGTPGTHTSVTVRVKNIGNTTSGSISITDGALSNRISTTTPTCTALAAGASCAVTIDWNNNGAGGYREENFTATESGGANSVLHVEGTK